MATNYINKLVISGRDDIAVKRVLDAIQFEEAPYTIDFNKIIPMPNFKREYLYDKDGKKTNSYTMSEEEVDWAYKHWGTKWNSYGYDQLNRSDLNSNEIRFLTANGYMSTELLNMLSFKYNALFSLYAINEVGEKYSAIKSIDGKSFPMTFDSVIDFNAMIDNIVGKQNRDKVMN